MRAADVVVVVVRNEYGSYEAEGVWRTEEAARKAMRSRYHGFDDITRATPRAFPFIKVVVE